MRPMNDPDYRYTPWTPERRKAASEAAKRKWAERRAREEAEYQREQRSIGTKLRQLRFAKASEMDELARRWHKLKDELAEIDRASTLVAELMPILRKHGLTNQG